MAKKQTNYEANPAAKRMTVTREFEAPLEKVWKAWTDPKLLEQWWAPRPWQAITISMDFREGGFWFYYMQGPEGERHYCKVDYLEIKKEKEYSAQDLFCDEKGNPNPEMPSMHWRNQFIAQGGDTKVVVEISFPSEEQMEAIIKMGFKEGFEMAHGNLDELLAR